MTNDHHHNYVIKIVLYIIRYVKKEYEQVREEARETAAEAGTEGSLPSHAHLCTTGHYAEYIAKNLWKIKLHNNFIERLYSEANPTVYAEKIYIFHGFFCDHFLQYFALFWQPADFVPLIEKLRPEVLAQLRASQVYQT